MKKIIFTALFLTIFAAPSFANIYIDPFLGYVNAGDAKNQIGFGGSLGMDITSDLTAVYRGAYSFKKDTYEVLTETKDKEYTHMTHLFGVEYIPEIGILKKIRLRWKNTILAGYSSTSIDIQDTGDSSDSGFAYAVSTGIIWDLSQHACPFIEAGWHQSYYMNDFKDSDILGFEILVGFRFSIWSQRDIGKNY